MKSIVALPALALSILALTSATLPAQGQWRSLFDGKSLDAWRIYKTDRAAKMCETPGAKNCWEIKDGVLQKDGHANDIV
jgi:hypothetical protein